MGSEKFCLRWNDFESNISNAFKELRDDKDFFDVTLACDDDQIQAHKVILSACSPFFRNILRRNPHQHPLLYMKGVKYTDLQSVLNFMYHGEVNVAQEELNSFLAVAEDLRVKGLTQNQASSHQTSSKQSESYQQARSTPLVSKSIPRTIEREPPPPPKRPRPPPPTIHDDDIQEVVPIKSEPRDSVPLPSPHVPIPAQPHVYSSVPQPVALDEQSVATYQEETGYEDYGDYQEQGYSEVDNSMEHTMTMQGTDPEKGHLDLTNVKSPDDLYQFCVKEVGETKWKCRICLQFRHGGRNQVRNHVESKHFPNMFEYNCKYCDKTCNTKKGLEVHISEKHRSANSTL
eukprot:GFUD01012147.1.p1 GENE.GFUD01012147.1~~GFUD01012147.1.p1  ORF type:complete len:345 (+),score=89.01 GFUD01012147.1:164-1198(+)